MKKIHFIFLMAILAGFFIVSCGKSKKGTRNIVPEEFKVGISDAISSPDLAKKSLLLPEEDPVKGEQLYQQLRTFVFVGESAAEIVNNCIATVRTLDIDGPTAFSFISLLDGYVKDVKVRENVDFRNTTWQYAMFITDKGENAFQLYWNLDPVNGLAIMNMGVFNRFALMQTKAMIMIEYSEDNPLFDRTMTVNITELDSTERNYMKKMRLFAGEKGEMVVLRGNSIHPAAVLVDDNIAGGRSWSFVARNNTLYDVAAARVALAPVTTATNTGLWTNYAMDKVLETEVRTVYSYLSATDLNSLVTLVTTNARAPGFFRGQTGFIASGLDNIPALPGFTPQLYNLDDLEPFIPNEVNVFTIVFGLVTD